MYLKSKDLDTAEMFRLVKNLGANDFEYMITETLYENKLSLFNSEALPDREILSLIRFSPDGELKIRKIRKDLYRCVYLGSQNVNYPLDDFSGEIKEFENNREKYKTVLWGERKPGQEYFVEQEIPHYFQYPVAMNIPGKSRVVLYIEVLKNRAGQIEFARYSHIEEVGEEELVCQ